MTDQPTEIDDQPSETRFDEAERAVKEAEQAYREATDAPLKLRRSYEAELETINKTLGQLGLETSVDEVVKLLNHRDALDFLIQASEKNVRPSRDGIDEATRQRDGVIHQYHRLMEQRARVEMELEYLEVLAIYARGGQHIPHHWLRKRQTTSRQSDTYLRQMIGKELMAAAQNFKPQKLVEVQEQLQRTNQAMEELGGDRLKTERLNYSY